METQIAKTKWVLDPAHSELQFKVKHLMISNVKGEFRKFQVEVDGESFETDPITVKIETASIYTNDDNRDNHLKAGDFFDSENHPEMVFHSESTTKTGENRYQLNGNLNIKGITKPVQLEMEFNGFNQDPWGNKKAGISLSGTINRSDWGLVWNAPLETGGFLVSEDVRLSADIQLLHQA
jgi:polyisoprenoid-binding protein YceI